MTILVVLTVSVAQWLYLCAFVPFNRSTVTAYLLGFTWAFVIGLAISWP